MIGLKVYLYLLGGYIINYFGHQAEGETHQSNIPLPLESKNHCPVLGRKTPILAIRGLVVVSKVAVQFLLALILTLRVAVVAVQPVPVQLTNSDFAAGAAVSITVASLV